MVEPFLDILYYLCLNYAKFRKCHLLKFGFFFVRQRIAIKTMLDDSYKHLIDILNLILC